MNNATSSVRVTHHDNNGTWIIALAGEHDLATSPLLAARTLAVWPHCSVAIVDLSAATFIDSSVMNWLVRARRTLEARGSSDAVRIVEGPQGNAVNLVFDALAVRDEFASYTAQDALAGEDRRVRSSAPGRGRLHGDGIRKIGKPGHATRAERHEALNDRQALAGGVFRERVVRGFLGSSEALVHRSGELQLTMLDVTDLAHRRRRSGSRPPPDGILRV